MVYNVYTDGSFKEVDGTGIYASAAVVYIEGLQNPIELTNAASDPAYASMRNVTGEVLAVFMAMEYLMNQCHITQEDSVTVHYDYEGIENWCRNPGEDKYWRAKNSFTQSYRNYILGKVKTRCKLSFHRTPGHTGIAGNERADVLARSAIERYVEGK